MLRSALHSPRLPSPTTNRGSLVPRAFRSLSRALHDAVDSRYLLLTASTALRPSAFMLMAAGNAALCRQSTVLNFASRGLPERTPPGSFAGGGVRSAWRTVRVVTGPAYPDAILTPHAQSQMQRRGVTEDNGQGGADSESNV